MNHNVKLLANMLKEKGIRYEEVEVPSRKNAEALIVTLGGKNMSKIQCQCVFKNDDTTIGGDIFLSITVPDMVTVPSRNLFAMAVLLNYLNCSYPFVKFSLDAADYTVEAEYETETSTAFGQHCQPLCDAIMTVASICDDAFPQIMQTAQE